MTEPKPKYIEGAQVYVRFELAEGNMDEAGIFTYEAYPCYDEVPKLNEGFDVMFDASIEIPEYWIESEVSMKEPTKAGTVVVVANLAWTRDGGVWYSVSVDERRVWQELCAMGTPKVIWEPKD